MSNLLASLKPFAPLLLTFFLPRLFNLYRTVKIAYKTRPPPRPCPPDAFRACNVLFFGTFVFFLQTLALPSFLAKLTGLGWLKGSAYHENIFWATNSRLKIPTDILFSRLASLRPNGLLTVADEALKGKIGTLAARELYLRYGPATLQNCSFCDPTDPQTYLLYYLPLTVVFPHLLQLLVIGLSTSLTIAGPLCAAWRTRLTVLSLILFSIDLWITVSYNAKIDPNMPSPNGTFWTLGFLRPLILCLFNSGAAFLVYASATNRFVLFTSPITPSPDAKSVARRQGQTLTQLTVALQVALTRLNAYHITRNAVVREDGLKQADDEYWRTVVAMEGPGGVESVWEDEEVRAAVSRVLGARGQGGMEKVNEDARKFVSELTNGLDRNGRRGQHNTSAAIFE